MMSFFFSFLEISHDSLQQEKAFLQRFLCHTQETSGEKRDEIKYRKQTCYFKVQRRSSKPRSKTFSLTECQEKQECGAMILDEMKRTHSLLVAPRIVALTDHVWTSQRCHIVLKFTGQDIRSYYCTTSCQTLRTMCIVGIRLGFCHFPRASTFNFSHYQQHLCSQGPND